MINKRRKKQTAMQKAIALAGNQQKLARICKTSQQNISYWLHHKPSSRAISLITKNLPIKIEEFF